MWSLRIILEKRKQLLIINNCLVEIIIKASGQKNSSAKNDGTDDMAVVR
jgi:hypothetical protein